jgi:hypothetical protein
MLWLKLFPPSHWSPVSDAVSCAKFSSGSHDAVVRVYDEAVA